MATGLPNNPGGNIEAGQGNLDFKEFLKSENQRAQKEFAKKREDLETSLHNDMPHTKPDIAESTEFWFKQVVDKLEAPLSKALEAYQYELGIIETLNVNPSLKEYQVKAAYQKYTEKIDSLVEIAKASVTSLKEGKPDLDLGGVAQVEKDAGKYLALMSSKGGALRDMFVEFVSVDKLSADHKKNLDAAFLGDNKETQDIALLLLSRAKIVVKDAYITHFVETYPQGAVAFLEKCNLYGCLSPDDMKKYFNALVSDKNQDVGAKKAAQEKLEKWDVEGKQYKEAYDAQQEALKKQEASFRTPDARGGAAKMLTAKGIGKFIAYACCITTVVANAVANRNNWKNNKAAFFKNPYLLAGLAGLAALHLNSTGKSFAEITMGKVGRDQLARKEKGRQLIAAQNGFFGWEEELGGDIGNVIGLYNQKLKEKKEPVAVGVHLRSFLEECKEYDKKKGNHNTEEAFNKLTKNKTKAQARRELKTFCVLFDDIPITNGEEYKTEVKNIKDQIS